MQLWNAQGAISICPISEPDFDSASKASGHASRVGRPRRGRVATHEILTHAYQLSFAGMSCFQHSGTGNIGQNLNDHPVQCL